MGTRVCSCERVRSRAGADDALTRGMCASATCSLCNAIHRWNTHICSVCIPNGAVSTRLATRTNGSPMRARHTRVRTCCVRARAHVRMCDWAATHPRGRMRARSVGMDRGWLGSQAFYVASAFNADIGAWNTAAVSNMLGVCAALSARRRATAGGTRSAGVRCGAGRCARRRPPMRARACVRRRVRTRMRGCARVGIAACSKDG